VRGTLIFPFHRGCRHFVHHLESGFLLLSPALTGMKNVINIFMSSLVREEGMAA